MSRGRRVTKKNVASLVVCFLSLFLNDYAYADQNDFDFSGGVFVGGNVFTQDIELGNSFHRDQVPESGFLLGGRFSYVLVSHLAEGTNWDPRLSAEVEGKILFSSTEGMGTRPSEFAPIFGWRANLVVDFWRYRTLAPFAILGFGGETLFSDSRYMESPDTDAIGYIGFGGQYRLSPKYGIRMDFRTGITAGRDQLAAPVIEAHAGLFYRFGTGSVPMATKIGKPATELPADSDEDGIVDVEDSCLTEPGIPENNGCPEKDIDGDGLIGSNDGCPSEAEDIDSFQDGDGCPDLDNDGDAIADSEDKCPNKAESINNFYDEDGCPDEVPVQLAKLNGPVRGVTFETGSTRFHRRSRPRLNRAAAILVAYPEVRVSISGHTDSRERPKRKISKRRADFVRTYLIRQGVRSTQLTTVGSGSKVNVAGNRTVRQRAKNRRVEFKLTLPNGTAPQYN